MVHEGASGSGLVGPRAHLAGRTLPPRNRGSRGRVQGPVLFRISIPIPEGGR